MQSRRTYLPSLSTEWKLFRRTWGLSSKQLEKASPPSSYFRKACALVTVLLTIVVMPFSAFCEVKENENGLTALIQLLELGTISSRSDVARVFGVEFIPRSYNNHVYVPRRKPSYIRETDDGLVYVEDIYSDSRQIQIHFGPNGCITYEAFKNATGSLFQEFDVRDDPPGLAHLLVLNAPNRKMQGTAGFVARCLSGVIITE